MVNKTNPTIDGRGPFPNLPLERFSSEQQPHLHRQVLASHVLASHNYDHADVIHLSAFFRDNPNPVLVFSPDGAVIRINPVAVRLLKRLQLESTDLLPTEHPQIVHACLEGAYKEYTLEITVNHHILALTYHPMPAFKLVYLYAIELTDYRRSEAELLRMATNTIALAKRTVLQLQTLRDKLPKPTVPTIAMQSAACFSRQTALTHSLTNWFVAMDGCVFASTAGVRGEE